jgi:mRNA interferase RelE/StbE
MGLIRIEFAKAVRKDFKKLPKKDAVRILKRIESLSENPRPPESKKLTNDESHRIRVGNYRVIYDIRDAVLVVLVLKVGKRKDFQRK